MKDPQQTRQGPHQAPTGPGQAPASQNVQLKRQLAGMSYADQVTMLSPSGSLPPSADAVQMKVSFTNEEGAEVELNDFAGSGDEAEKVEECKSQITSGQDVMDFEWVKARVARNDGKVPGSIKKFKAKWGSTHGNYDGYLPGVKGAGGYNEYYVRQGDGISSTRRIVKGGPDNALFYTNTHYGRDGAPNFYHLGS